MQKVEEIPVIYKLYLLPSQIWHPIVQAEPTSEQLFQSFKETEIWFRCYFPIPHVNFFSRSSSVSSDGEIQGPLCDTISRKTLFYLITTLNASFHPDYDFSDAKSTHFSKEPSLNVRSVLNSSKEKLFQWKLSQNHF